MRLNTSLVLGLALAFALALTGCASNGDDSTGGSSSTGSSTSSGSGSTPAGTGAGSTKTNPTTRSGGSTSTSTSTSGAGASRSTGGGMSSMQDGRTGSVSMAIPTGEKSTSALLLEMTAPAEVRVGQPYNYEMRVTNLTRLVLEGVEVSDTLTGNYTISNSQPAAQRGAGGKVSWNLGSLQPGQSKSIRVTGTANAVGSVINCASAKFNSSACLTTVVTQPKLQLTKQAPAEILACDPVPLRFTVTNNGTGVARNVVISETLPCNWTIDGRPSFSKSVGNLAAGQSKTIELTAKAQGRGRCVCHGTATADGGLTTKSNSTTTLVKLPVLAIKKNGPSKRFIGRNVIYEITVTNSGDGVAKNAMIEDVLPSGSTFVSASDGGRQSGGKVVWSAGNMAPGASKKVSLTVKSSRSGTLTNTATAKAYCAAAVSDSASTAVEGIPAILLEVIDVEDPIEVGNNVVYVITVTNQGSAPGTNIRVRCGLESAARFVSGSGSTSVSSSGSTITCAPVGSLAPKAKASWRLTVKAASASDVRFKVSMTSDQSTRPVEETESTNFYE